MPPNLANALETKLSKM